MCLYAGSQKPLMTMSTRGPWWRRQHVCRPVWPRAPHKNRRLMEESPTMSGLLLSLPQKLQVPFKILGTIAEFACRYVQSEWLSFSPPGFQRNIRFHRQHKYLKNPWNTKEGKLWSEGESLSSAHLQASCRYRITFQFLCLEILYQLTDKYVMFLFCSFLFYIGKLKPFEEPKENTAGNKSLISNSHQKNYKKHQVQTRYVLTSTHWHILIHLL